MSWADLWPTVIWAVVYPGCLCRGTWRSVPLFRLREVKRRSANLDILSDSRRFMTMKGRTTISMSSSKCPFSRRAPR